jgi:hypothetical protein
MKSASSPRSPAVDRATEAAMPSPFPGMDPYLESPGQWPDFHHEFISALRSEVADKLPPNYIARIDEFVLRLEPETRSRRSMEPDVIVSRSHENSANLTTQPSVATAVDVASRTTRIPNIVPIDPHTESYIELRYRPTNELVGVIELLSPTNKSGVGRIQYLAKRDIFLEEPVHLIEIDLIRAGVRIELLRPLPAGHYYTFVSRANARPECELYNWSVRDTFPRIAIPLREPDADVVIDLGIAFASAYQRGRYERVISYTDAAPPPRFDGSDAEWVLQKAREVVQSR